MLPSNRGSDKMKVDALNLLARQRGRTELGMLENGDAGVNTGTRLSVPSSSGERQRQASFPEKLMALLDSGVFGDAGAWSPGGKTFWILSKLFAPAVLAEHFQGCKLESFKRKLKRWGFKRVSNTGCPRSSLSYRCDHFERGRPDLLWKIKGMRKTAPLAASDMQDDVSSPQFASGAGTFDGVSDFQPTMPKLPAVGQAQHIHERLAVLDGRHGAFQLGSSDLLESSLPLAPPVSALNPTASLLGGDRTSSNNAMWEALIRAERLVPQALAPIGSLLPPSLRQGMNSLQELPVTSSPSLQSLLPLPLLSGGDLNGPSREQQALLARANDLASTNLPTRNTSAFNSPLQRQGEGIAPSVLQRLSTEELVILHRTMQQDQLRSNLLGGLGNQR